MSKSTLINAVTELLGKEGDVPVSNPNNSINRAADSFENIKLLTGIITKAGVGSYTYIVEVPSVNTNMICMAASSLLPLIPFNTGTAASSVYSEGSEVIVAVLSPVRGVIVCSIPTTVPDDSYFEGGSVLHSQLLSETGVNKFTNEIYSEDNVTLADNHRPVDLLPGDAVWLNEFKVGLGILKLLSFLQASDRAKIELFTLDDLVRVTSGQFQHNSAIGIENIYNDNGHITKELVGSNNQCEVFGRSTYDRPLLEEDASTRQDTNNNTDLKHRYDYSDPYIRARFSSYIGHLGGIFSFFVSSPKADIEVTRLSDRTLDHGLFHASVDSGGRLMVQSAAGICLQRTDKIPVPKRIAQPWNSNLGYNEPVNKVAFEWDSEYPEARNLHLRDAFAYYTKNAYQRFIDDNGFYIPELADITNPPDAYEAIVDGGLKVLGTENFEANKNASSYFHMGEDGSITIRGKCGEEISMKGGNIILSCPGNIEMRPGKSSVTMSGADTIIKSKKSTDISSTQNDVRIKAEKNLHIYSASGGILIESDATEDTQNYGGGEDEDGNPLPPPGEGTVSSGIVLKATKSRIFQWGEKLHSSFKDIFWIESLAAENTNGGILQVVSKHIRMFAREGEAFIKTAASALHLTDTVGRLLGEGVELVGKNSANVMSDGEVHRFMGKQAPLTPYNPYEAIITKRLDNLDTAAHKDTDLEEPYTLENREDIKFHFRNSEQYGTTDLIMAESPWVYLKDTANSPFIEGTTSKWEEKEVNNTYPYPGKDCYDTDCLVILKNESNSAQEGDDDDEHTVILDGKEVVIETTKSGRPKKVDADGYKVKKYEEISNKGGELDKVSLNSLTVMS